MKNKIVLKSNSNNGKALLLALKFTTVFVVFRFVFELYRSSVWKERELNSRMDVIVVSRKVYLIEWLEFISLIFQIALMVVCAFLFIRWMHRAYYNAIQLQFQPVSYELPWAIWGWFIPLKNTSIPHIILSEIMVTMEQVLIAKKQLVYRQKRHSIKVLWWLLLIVAMLFLVSVLCIRSTAFMQFLCLYFSLRLQVYCPFGCSLTF